jgi:hypothetical protein
MKIRIEVDANGNVSAFTESGNFEEGRDVIKKMFAGMNVTIPFAEIGEPEQHRHDDALLEAHVHNNS